MVDDGYFTLDYVVGFLESSLNSPRSLEHDVRSLIDAIRQNHRVPACGCSANNPKYRFENGDRFDNSKPDFSKGEKT